MLKKQCDRCQSLMLEEKIKLTSESLEQRFLSAYHCIYCGRPSLKALPSPREQPV